MSINTVTKLLVDAGAGYQDKTVRILSWKSIQVDEIGAFCDAKATERREPEGRARGCRRHLDVDLPSASGRGKTKFTDSPDMRCISTSFAERQNLTVRMSMRRFTRVTNAFSKKAENLGHALALHFMYYNFCRIQKTLRITPAMAAGVTDHVWSLQEIADWRFKPKS